MKLKDIALSAAYVGQMVVKAIAVGAQEVWSAVKYIVFADPVVEQICVANFSSDGVGLLPEDAAKVTDLGTVFRANTEITSFDELEKFTGITAIGGSAPGSDFGLCTSLKSVKLPPNLSIVGNQGFKNCPLSIRLYSETIISLYRESFRGTGITDINLPNLESTGDESFNGCKSLVSVTNLGKVKSIAWGMFFGCTSLRSINIPETVTSIVNGAFNGCNSLENVIIPEGVTTIKNDAFYGCEKIDNIAIPSAVTNIGYSAFRNMKSLKVFISNPTTPPTIGSLVFNGANSALAIYVPDQSVQAYRGASGWLDYADRIKPLSLYVEPTNE